ncbi:MAG: DNA primase [Thermodesulfobacteriota bacterium]|nr:DNA primase [Thermodesulfobacteriota bacterium]
MEYTGFNDDLPARIKEQADIVQVIGECVELKRAGVRFLGLCPFHNEKTPSFSVHPGQQFFHCFGCGASGDVFEFQMKYHNLDFPTAMKELARRYQVEIPERPQSSQEREKSRRRKSMYAVNEKAVSIFRKTLLHSSQAKAARQYLEERQISAEIQERFGLGYAPSPDAAGWNFLGAQLGKDEQQAAIEAGLLVKKDKGGTYDRFRDRVLFPLYDRRGRVIGFGGRIIGEGQPKYMNSPESLVFSKSASLLGLYQQGDEIRRRKQAILVEGNFDLVSLVVHGCPNVVAPLGTALTIQQLKLLKGYAEECVLLFDGDAAGVKAAIRSVPLFLSEQMAGKVAMLPGGHDPDTFIREEGLAALNTLLEQAMPLPEFTLQQLVKEHGLTLDGKTRIIAELQPLLKAASSTLQRSLILSHFSETIGVSAEELGASMPPVPPVQPDPPAIESEPARFSEQLSPLSSSQKRLVTHMVLYPGSLSELKEAGLRRCLSGTIGEVLLLQLLALLERAGNVEPEELLDKLPPGGERVLVSDILLSSSSESAALYCPGTEGELTEILIYLECETLKRRIKELKGMLSDQSASRSVEDQQELGVEMVEVKNRLEDQQKKYTPFSL